MIAAVLPLAARQAEAIPLRILAIEDNPGDADLIRLSLAQALDEGAELLVAGTLKEGLTVLERQSVHLTLLDLGLPDSNGLEALRRLPPAASGPVVVLTGRDTAGLLSEALLLRAYDVLSKKDLSAVTMMRLVRLARGQWETESELRRAENRFRQVFEHSPDAIFVHFGECILLANPEAVRLLGADAEAQVVGLTYWNVLDPLHHEASRERLRRLAAGESLPLVEKCYVRLDGTRVDVEVALAAFEFNGRTGVQVTARDITKRKRDERLLALEHAVMRSLAEAGEVQEGVRAALAAICTDMAWDFGRLWRWDEGAGVLRAGTIWAVADPAIEKYVADTRDRTFPPGEGLLGLVRTSGEPLWIPDASVDDRVLHRDFVTGPGFRVRGICMLPVTAGGRVVAVLALVCRNVRRPDPRLLAAVQMVVGLLGQFFERTDLESRLRRFREAMDASADFILMIDPQSLRYVDANETAVQRLGYSREELLANGPLSVFSSSREALSAEYARLASGELAAETVTGSYRCRDGTIIPVEASRRFVALGGTELIVSVARDISERLLGEDSLRRFRSALDLSADAVYLIDAGTLEIVDCNKGALAALGYAAEELVGTGAERIFVDRSRAALLAEYAALGENSDSAKRIEAEHRRKDGSTFPVEIVRRRLHSQGRDMVVGVARDLTERRAAEKDLHEAVRRFELVTLATNDSIWDWDLANDTFWRNSNYEKRFGICPDAAGGGATFAEWSDRVHPEDHDRTVEGLLALVEGGAGKWGAEYRFRRADGTYAHVYDRGIVIRDAEGQPVRMIGSMTDISKRKAAEESLAYLAQYDQLTGLPNRTRFSDRLDQAVTHARRRGRTVGVLFVDLDRFKLVNDTLGHEAGDRTLVEVAARLKACVRDGDTVGRLSGDEFALVLDDMNDGHDAADVARKALAALGAPLQFDSTEALVTASIGIAVFPADGDDGSELLRNADAAMYAAKEAGRNRFSFYTAELNERAGARLRLVAELRHALERREFLLYYQPKVDLETGAISGFEALLRWQHPGRGLVSPLEFIPVLEETGLIVEVGEWALRSVCAQIRAWKDAGIVPRPVAVNLSGRQFQRESLDTMIGGILAEYRVEPDLLDLELTESMLMGDVSETVKVLGELKKRGLRVAVDDFGTGYSSLAYLRRFPLDCLKIDRAFIRDCVANPDDAAIVLAIVGLAQTLGLKVVAEGVETEAQLMFLRLHGCDEMQGYYFSKPVPAADATRMLSEDARIRMEPAAGHATAVTVLVVDDYQFDLDLMREKIAPAGYRILLADTPEKAFTLLASEAVDVVISDHSMPGMNGVKFLAGVRRLYPNVLRILFSGSGDRDAAADGVNAAGISKFLSKNWDEERLRAEIREALRRERDPVER